ALGHLGDGEPRELLGEDRCRRLRDHAPLAGPGRPGDGVALEDELQRHLVAARRVELVRLDGRRVAETPMPRALHVIDDDLLVQAVELGHQAPNPRKKSIAAGSSARYASISSGVVYR